MKFIQIMLEMLLPMVIIFGVLPRIFKVFKEVVVGEEPKKKKKKKNKPKFIVDRIPPPPPSRKIGSRREDTLREFVERYEVKGGRIVKKTLAEWDEIEKKKKTHKEFDTITPNPSKKKHFTKGVDPDFL